FLMYDSWNEDRRVNYKHRQGLKGPERRHSLMAKHVWRIMGFILCIVWLASACNAQNGEDPGTSPGIEEQGQGREEQNVRSYGEKDHRGAPQTKVERHAGDEQEVAQRLANLATEVDGV